MSSLPTQVRLNNHLIRWNEEIAQFEAALKAYGEAKADLEYRRAVTIQTAKHQDEKLTQAAAERIADGDQETYRLHREYRAAEALVEAKRARLRWCSAVADALRSEVSTERSERQLYADHGGDQ